AEPLFRRHVLECLEPDVGVAIGRRAPVAARRKRAARTDLGRIRDGAARVLTHLKEAAQEHTEPFADRGELVLVAPRAPAAEGDLRRRVAEAQRVYRLEAVTPD